MSTGMTYDEVLDQLDLPAVQGFTRYWERYPPVHVMVASYFGIPSDSSSSSKARSNSDDDIAKLLEQLERTPAP